CTLTRKRVVHFNPQNDKITDPGADFDGDGISNSEELAANTNMYDISNSTSVLSVSADIQAVCCEGGGLGGADKRVYLAKVAFPDRFESMEEGETMEEAPWDVYLMGDPSWGYRFASAGRVVLGGWVRQDLVEYEGFGDERFEYIEGASGTPVFVTWDLPSYPGGSVEELLTLLTPESALSEPEKFLSPINLREFANNLVRDENGNVLIQVNIYSSNPCSTSFASAAPPPTRPGIGEGEAYYDEISVDLDGGQTYDVERGKSGPETEVTPEPPASTGDSEGGSRLDICSSWIAYSPMYIVPVKNFETVNTGDIDFDGVPNYADGIEEFAGQYGDISDPESGPEGGIYILHEIHLPEGLGNLDEILIRLDYVAADPSNITVNSVGEDSYQFSFGSTGNNRIWLKDGDTPRSKEPIDELGDFVPAGEYIPLSDFGEAYNPATRTLNVFAESLRTSPAGSFEALAVSYQTTSTVAPEYINQPSIIPVSYLATHYNLPNADLVERDPDDGEIISSGGLYYDSNPIPNIDLTLDSAEINDDGNLVVTVTGQFSDRLSELIDESDYRVQDVTISCNGEDLETITMNYGGAGVMPWQPHTSDNDFTRTFTVENPGPQTYTIRAETGQNAVGNVGWDSVSIGLQNVEIVNSTPAPSADVSIVFNQKLNAQTIETAQVYFGDREVLPTDPIVTESAAGSYSFEGSILVNGELRPCSFQIFKNSEFSDTGVDNFSTEFKYTVSSGGVTTVLEARGHWEESSPSSLRFYPVEFYHEEIFYDLVISHTLELEGSPEGSVVPMVWRSGISGNELIEDEDSMVFVGDTRQTLAPFTYSPTYQYIVDDSRRGRPKIFVVTAEELPADLDYLTPSDITSDGQLSFSLKRDAEDKAFSSIDVSILESDFGTWEPEGDDYDGAVTMPVLLTYFELLYGEPGLELLSYFQQANGEIILDDFADNCDLDYWGVERPRIEIEEDKDPIWAANCLMEKLRQSMAYYDIRKVILENGDLALLSQAIQQQAQGAAEVGLAAANVYLAGLSLVNEGTDWVVTINELAQGEYTAAIGFIPFIPAGARFVIQRADGTVVQSFSSEVVDQIRNALRVLGKDRARSRLDRMDALSDLLDQNIITRGHLEAFYDSGLIKVSEGRSRALLRELLSPKPSGMRNPRAHHDLPLEFEREFISAGLDPNNYGRWVPNALHREWHRGAGGGFFNDEWEEFLFNGGVSMQRSKAEILDFLDYMRNTYRLDD
ncbi:MAG: hypothetical protein ACPGN3_05245, partial [Opitutales bacterium]